MKYKKATKIKSEDKIVVKKTKEILTVFVPIVEKDKVIFLCYNGKEYENSEVY